MWIFWPKSFKEHKLCHILIRVFAQTPPRFLNIFHRIFRIGVKYDFSLMLERNFGFILKQNW